MESRVASEIGSSSPLPTTEAAEIIIDGIENNRYRVLVGSDARTMDFVHHLHPLYAADMLFKRMKSLTGRLWNRAR